MEIDGRNAIVFDGGTKIGVLVTDEEAAAVGLFVGGSVNTWGEKIRPVLIEKGVPEKCLYIGAPCKMTRHEGRKVTSFVFPNPKDPHDRIPR